MKKIPLEIMGVDYNFEVDVDKYNKYINAMMPNNKIAPAKNFVNACVCDDSKQALKEIIGLPGAALHIAGELVDEFQPDFNIVAKKQPSTAAE